MSSGKWRLFGLGLNVLMEGNSIFQDLVKTNIYLNCPSHLKTCPLSIIDADALMMQGDRASAAMVLMHLSWKLPVSGPEGLIIHCGKETEDWTEAVRTFTSKHEGAVSI